MAQQQHQSVAGSQESQDEDSAVLTDSWQKLTHVRNCGLCMYVYCSENIWLRIPIARLFSNEIMDCGLIVSYLLVMSIGQETGESPHKLQ